MVSLFLLTVFGLLLGAGIKGRMAKAGTEIRLPWHTNRKWWQVSGALHLSTTVAITCLLQSNCRIHRSCCRQAWVPGRFDDDDVALRRRPSSSARARGNYIAVSDSAGDRPLATL